LGDNWKYILPVIIAALLAPLATSLYGSNGLFVTPKFDVQINENSNASEKLVIKNIGWQQAKNVILYVKSSALLHFDGSDCPETNTSSSMTNTTFSIQFPRLSTNIDCGMNFQNLKTGKISNISVTADNAPGYQLYIVNNQTTFSKTDSETSVLLQGVITSVIASGVVGIVTWFVRTRVVKSMAQVHDFTLERFQKDRVNCIRMRNSGRIIENCHILCDKKECTWEATTADKIKNILEGSIEVAQLPELVENVNPLITIKSGETTLRKIRFNDMAQG